MVSRKMDSSGKVVVVTGASMGIGEAIARTFADHGASVILLSRDAGRAEAARGRVGHTERTLALSCDVRHREEIDRVLSLTLHHFDRVDIWVNNAGHGLLDSVAQMDMAACRDTFDSNFFGTVAAMQAVIPVMKQQGSGMIVNISSVAGHIPLPFHALYSATKFAMNAIGKAARIELKNSGIHVMTVCPGYVRTDFGANAIRGSRELDRAIKGTDFDGLDLLPSDFTFRNLDLLLDDTNKPTQRLARLLRPLAASYDMVFLDCPPGISLLSEAVLRAADLVLAPIIPTTLSVRTLDQLTGFIDGLDGHRPAILAFCSMIDRRKRLHKQIAEQLPAERKDVAATAIPALSLIERMAVQRAPVTAFAPRSEAGRSYARLWAEVRARVG